LVPCLGIILGLVVKLSKLWRGSEGLFKDLNQSRLIAAINGVHLEEIHVLQEDPTDLFCTVQSLKLFK
jgi:hypothetical protein